MKKRTKSPREKLADLSRAYGSFAELGRRTAKFLGVKESTASKYVAEMIRGERSVDPRLNKTINRRVYYEQVQKPRLQIKRATEIKDKLEIASKSIRKEILLDELIPENTASFGFNFIDDIQNDPRFKFVLEAIEKGLSINIVARGQTPDGEPVQMKGTIGGTDLIEDRRGKKRKKKTRRYISELYHIIRSVYELTESEAFLTIETQSISERR